MESLSKRVALQAAIVAAALTTGNAPVQAMPIDTSYAWPGNPQLQTFKAMPDKRPFKGAGHGSCDKAVLEGRKKAKASRKARRAQRKRLKK